MSGLWMPSSCSPPTWPSAEDPEWPQGCVGESPVVERSKRKALDTATFRGKGLRSSAQRSTEELSRERSSVLAAAQNDPSADHGSQESGSFL